MKILLRHKSNFLTLLLWLMLVFSSFILFFYIFGYIESLPRYQSYYEKVRNTNPYYQLHVIVPWKILTGKFSDAAAIYKQAFLQAYPVLHRATDHVESRVLLKADWSQSRWLLSEILEATSFDDAKDILFDALDEDSPVREELNDLVSWIVTGQIGGYSSSPLIYKALVKVEISEESVVAFLKSLFDTEKEFELFKTYALKAITNFEASFKPSWVRQLFSSRTETPIFGMLNAIEVPALLRSSAQLFIKEDLAQRYRHNLPDLVKDITERNGTDKMGNPIVSQKHLEPVIKSLANLVWNIATRSAFNSNSSLYDTLYSPLTRLSRLAAFGVEQIVQKFASPEMLGKATVVGKALARAKGDPDLAESFKFLKARKAIKDNAPDWRKLSDGKLYTMSIISQIFCSAIFPASIFRSFDLYSIWKRIVYLIESLSNDWEDLYIIRPHLNE